MIEVISKGYPFKPDVGCFGYASSLIIRASKTILFDTGGYNLRQTIFDHLDEIECVVVSHLHFDHCSNLDLFIGTSIPIYISAKELEYYSKNFALDLDLFSYFNYIKNKINIIPIYGECLLAEDIKIIPTPGHTPGHISVTVSNKIILAGDSLKTYNDYINVESYGNAYDREQYLETKNYIKNNFKTIYPGHDSAIINGTKGSSMSVIEF